MAKNPSDTNVRASTDSSILKDISIYLSWRRISIKKSSKLRVM